MKVEHDVPLANTLRLPARARHRVQLEQPGELAQLLADTRWRDLPRTVLGEGSNVVLRGDVPGLVLQAAMRGMQVERWNGSEALVRCGAGENWDALVRWSLAQGLAGLENLSLIPGSVGAAPFQNIGAYGVELSDRLVSLRACSLEDGREREFSLAECGFAYRDSLFKSGQPGRWLITEVQLRLARDLPPVLDYADLAERFAALPAAQRHAAGLRDIICTLRRSKLPDPAQLPNAGSFFKNPLVSAGQHAALRERFPALVSYPQADGRFKLAAGWLIEQVGWKGRREGDVGMHAQQALVLVNHGQASGEQVLAVAAEVREAVRARFAVTLEQEPVILP
mgnify:CR=1 FL=1